MKRNIVFALVFVLSGVPGFAASLATAARSVIPQDVQQIINVDYRRMKNSDTAMQMKAKLLPANMKQFEDALKDVGVVVDATLIRLHWLRFAIRTTDCKSSGLRRAHFRARPSL